MTTKSKTKNISSYKRQSWKIKELETQCYQLKMALADEEQISKLNDANGKEIKQLKDIIETYKKGRELNEKAIKHLDSKIQELSEYEHAQRKLDTLCEMMDEFSSSSNLNAVSKLNTILGNLNNVLIENKKLREKTEELDKIGRILKNDSRLEDIPISRMEKVINQVLMFIGSFEIMNERNECIEKKLICQEKEINENKKLLDATRNALNKRSHEVNTLTGLIKGLIHG